MAYNDERVTYFAETDSRNKRVAFGIKAKDRTKHIYVIGKTGMGKSTLLENMAAQDIRNGEGFAFIDPHGKTAEVLLDYIPEDRIDDVLYFAPFDTDHPIAFNVMEDVGPDKRHLVLAGLMSAFKKIWVDAWSARMEYILSNTILALLEYPDSTLLSVSRMLSNKEYRKKVVDNITDVSVKSFWVDEFAKYTDRFAAEATPAIQNKIGQFTSNPLIRNIIGQPHSTFDIRKLMDERKIIIVNLSKGRVGEANANLLGSMLITKIYLAAMSRADVPDSILKGLPNFYLYVDEFQSFANESFADILSEARKYKLNLTIAHQYIEQMSDEVRAAVFGNVGTMITFRIGASDAEVFEKEFAPQFIIEDLVNLGFAQIYLRLMIDGISSQPFSATTLPPIAPPGATKREEVIASSRKKFGNEKETVEQSIKEDLAPIDVPQKREEVKNTNASHKKNGGKEKSSESQHEGVPTKILVDTHSHTQTKSYPPNSNKFSEQKKNDSAPSVVPNTSDRHHAERVLAKPREHYVSLSSLPSRGAKVPEQINTKNVKNSKSPTEENMNALRSVLKQVMQNDIPKEKDMSLRQPFKEHLQKTEKKTVYTREEYLARTQKEQQVKKEPVSEEKKENIPPAVPRPKEPSGKVPAEIPEDVLKKTLAE